MHRSSSSGLAGFTFLALSFALPPSAPAQSYPTRPIRLVVPFPPGGTIDMVGRMVAQGLGDRVGQTVVVDNRGGAGGIRGAELVVKAAADGYTLCLCSAGAMISSPLLATQPPYDGRDFAPVTLIATVPYLLLVRNGSGLMSFKDLLAAARQKPGSLNYGSAGNGSTSHLAAAMFVSMGINVVHVPYKGSAPAATDLFGGQIQLVFEAIGAGAQYARTGRLRALGVSSLKRSQILPELPTICEQGVTEFEARVDKLPKMLRALALPRGVTRSVNIRNTHDRQVPLFRRRPVLPFRIGAKNANHTRAFSACVFFHLHQDGKKF